MARYIQVRDDSIVVVRQPFALFCPLQVFRCILCILCILCLFLPLPGPGTYILIRMRSNPSLVVPYLRVLPQPIAAHLFLLVYSFCLVSTANSAVAHVDTIL